MDHNMDGYEASAANYPGSPQAGTGAPVPGGNAGAPVFNENTGAPVFNENTGAPVFNENTGAPVFNENTGAPVFNENTGAPAFNGNAGSPAFNENAGTPAFGGNAGAAVPNGNAGAPVPGGNAAEPVWNGAAAGPVYNGSAAGPEAVKSAGGMAPNENPSGAPLQGNPGIPSSQDTAGKAASQAARKEHAKKKFSLKEWVPGPQVPNQLTIGRICMIPLFVILILWVPKPAGNILSMIVFIVASLTDTLDGYIARRYNYVSTFGKFMDPLADKLLVCSALICLVDIGRIESWIVIIIIAREFIISGFRLVAVEKGVVIAANIWGKVKTVFQMLMVILMLGNFQGFLGVAAQILKWFALALTIISLATYLLQNRKVLQDQV